MRNYYCTIIIKSNSKRPVITMLTSRFLPLQLSLKHSDSELLLQALATFPEQVKSSVC